MYVYIKFVLKMARKVSKNHGFGFLSKQYKCIYSIHLKPSGKIEFLSKNINAFRDLKKMEF